MDENIDSNNLEEAFLPSPPPFQTSPPASEDSKKSCLASPTPGQSSSTPGSVSNESADDTDIVVFEDLISYLTVNKKSCEERVKFHEKVEELKEFVKFVLNVEGLNV